jgi:hypothetical protein
VKDHEEVMAEIVDLGKIQITNRIAYGECIEPEQFGNFIELARIARLHGGINPHPSSVDLISWDLGQNGDHAGPNTSEDSRFHRSRDLP